MTLGILKISRLSRAYRPGLDKKNARNDLQTVGDSVSHLLQQDFFLLKQIPQFDLSCPPLGDVFDAQ